MPSSNRAFNNIDRSPEPCRARRRSSRNSPQGDSHGIRLRRLPRSPSRKKGSSRRSPWMKKRSSSDSPHPIMTSLRRERESSASSLATSLSGNTACNSILPSKNRRWRSIRSREVEFLLRRERNFDPLEGQEPFSVYPRRYSPRGKARSTGKMVLDVFTWRYKKNSTSKDPAATETRKAQSGLWVDKPHLPAVGVQMTATRDVRRDQTHDRSRLPRLQRDDGRGLPLGTWTPERANDFPMGRGPSKANNEFLDFHIWM